MLEDLTHRYDSSRAANVHPLKECYQEDGMVYFKCSKCGAALRINDENDVHIGVVLEVPEPETGEIVWICVSFCPNCGEEIES